MGLFDMFKKKPEPAAAPAGPASVKADAAADTLVAPRLWPRGQDDRRARSRLQRRGPGKGCAVWPDDETVYAPISGTVTVTMGPAVGITGDDGIEVLVHIGVDTVDMNGKGFTGYVKQGDKVKAGDPCIKMTKADIAAAGHPDCVVLAVSNTPEFADVQLIADPESTVAAGTAVVKVVR